MIAPHGIVIEPPQFRHNCSADWMVAIMPKEAMPMPAFIQTLAYWTAKAKLIAENDQDEYTAYAAAADYSRGGRVVKLLKPDGTVVTYHNGQKV